jgi:hypothetical protein
VKRLLDIEPLTGIQTFHEYDHQTGITTIERVQDVKPILDRNKRLANEDDYKKSGIKSSWMHGATIPNVIIEKWLKEGIDVFNKDHWPRVRSKLNSSEYRYLKTLNGTI